MPKNYSKWSVEEQLLLKTMKKSQIAQNLVDWEAISLKISRQLGTNKSGKQCRQRYINYLKFEETGKLNPIWSQEELTLLITLYSKHGKSWSLICDYFPNKSENCIKNKFNNEIKKLVRIIKECESIMYIKSSQSINAGMVLVILDFACKIKKTALALGLTINSESNIFRFQNQILKLSFAQNQSPTFEKLVELVKLIKWINQKIRSFGHFRAKSQRSWNITLKNLETINKFDKVICEDLVPYTETSMRCEKSSQTLQTILVGDKIKENQLHQLEIDIQMSVCLGNTFSLIDQANSILDYDQDKIEPAQFGSF